MLRALGFLLQFLVIGLFVNTGLSLKCFICENKGNPACGMYFKPYQFKAYHCPGPDFKCALQRQRTQDDWVGIVRVCYQLGSLPGMNETNGCKNWTNDQHQHGYTAYYCFCDTDYCNSAPKHSGLFYIVTVLCMLILIV